MAVICWVAGFDIIYALQDIHFDQEHQLYSIPARFGMTKALLVSSCLHLVCAVSIIIGAWILHQEFGLNYLSYLGSSAFIVLLFIQHRIVSRGDLSKINLAFLLLMELPVSFLPAVQFWIFIYNVQDGQLIFGELPFDD